MEIVKRLLIVHEPSGEKIVVETYHCRTESKPGENLIETLNRAIARELKYWGKELLSEIKKKEVEKL